MDEQYRQIYSDIYNSTSYSLPVQSDAVFREEFPPNSVRTIQAVYEAIESPNLPQGRPQTLREDAKAFLALNFTNLIVAPLLIGGRVSPDDLSRDTQEDINMLVRRAAGGTSGEVSAHRIVDALSKSWEDLRVGRYEIWE
jgi:hypothetical protein